MHRSGVQDREERMAALKQTKMQMRSVRDKMKDLFELLFVDG